MFAKPKSGLSNVDIGIKPFQSPVASFRSNTVPGIKTVPSSIPGVGLLNPPRIKPFTTSGQLPGVRTASPTKPMLGTVSNFAPSLPSISVPSFTPFGTGGLPPQTPKPFDFGFPNLGKGGAPSTPTFGFVPTKKKKTGYNPTLYAAALNIRGKRNKKERFGELTGLGVRPIIR